MSKLRTFRIPLKLVSTGTALVDASSEAEAIRKAKAQQWEDILGEEMVSSSIDGEPEEVDGD